MASQRLKGQGTFRRYKDGWQWILRKKGEPVLTGTGKTKKAAEANGRKKIASPSSTTSKTLAEAWKEMEPELCRQLSPTNSAAYRSTFTRISGSSFASKIPYTSITADQLLEGVPRGSLSVVTWRGHLTRIRAVLNRLGHKVMVELPKPPRKEKTTVWGSDKDEFLGFVRSLPLNRRVALALIYLTGLRRSEACGVRFEDLEEKAGGAYLRLAVTETDDGIHIRPRFKTRESASFVPMGRELLGWIAEWAEGRSTGFVLSRGDDPLRPHSLTNLVRRTVKGTKWAAVTPQALRRGFGQAVWETTGDAKLGAAMMRHSLGMFDKEYVQVDRGIKSRAHDLVFGNRAKTRSKRKAK